MYFTQDAIGTTLAKDKLLWQEVFQYVLANPMSSTFPWRECLRKKRKVNFAVYD